MISRRFNHPPLDRNVRVNNILITVACIVLYEISGGGRYLFIALLLFGAAAVIYLGIFGFVQAIRELAQYKGK